MSNAVVLTSNNAEFENYLSDTFRLKKNNEVCLAKAAVSVPVEIHQFATVPIIPTAERTRAAFTAVVDGLEHGVTWTELHASYTVLDLQSGFEPLGIDDFFSGQVDLPLSNFVIFKNAAGDLKKRVDVSELLAHAFEQKFQFYSAVPTPKLTQLNGTSSSQSGSVVLDGDAYSIERVEPHAAEVGLKFVYSPKNLVGRQVLSTGAELFQAVDAAVVTVTDDAVNGCSIVATNAGSAHGQNPIDPNGGYVMFKVGAQANNSDFEFGLATLFARSPAAEVTTNDIQFGLKISTDGQGVITLKVKDNGVTKPQSAVARVAVDDHYFVQVQRRGTGDPVYVCSILMNSTDSNIADAFLTHQSVVSQPDAASLVPVYVATAAGGTVSHLRLVPIGADSLSMLVTYNALNNPELVGTCSVSASPPATYNNPPTAIRFFQQLGFSLGNYPNTLNEDFGVRNYADKPNALVQVHTTPRKCHDNVAVNVGAQSVADTLQETVLPGGGRVLTYRNKGSKVPRFLDVELRNMPVRSLAGNLAATGFTTASVTRDVCHIPTPAETLDATASFDLNLSYEPYNPVYRQLNNTELYSVNQLQVAVGYKDFFTNEAKQIRNINGNLKLELHFRPSKNRIA